MREDKKLETMNIISVSDQNFREDYIRKIDDFLGKVKSDNSRRYAIPNGYWTLEVFYNGATLIPEERVECAVEPQLDEQAQMLDVLDSRRHNFFQHSKPTWRPVTVTYAAYGDNVGSMLINDWEELQMVHHATAELTYWLGVDNPDRTWTLKDWIVVNFQTTPSKSAILGVDLTFLFSEASLTKH